MLLVSPSLAQTIGLEEALLVQLLHDLQMAQGQRVVQMTEAQSEQLLPFWSTQKLLSVLKRLQALGIVQIERQQPCLHLHLQLPDNSTSVTQASAKPQPIRTASKMVSTRSNPISAQATPTPIPTRHAAAPDRATTHERAASTERATIPERTTFPERAAAPERVAPQETENLPDYAMNEARMRNQSEDDLAYLRPASAQRNRRPHRKSKMYHDWEPSEDFPSLLSFHDIPLPFALSEMGKFRQYYLSTDRTEFSWDVRFLNWVQRAWADSLNSKGRHEQQQANNSEPADSARGARTKVRDALRNIQDTDW